MPNNVLQEPKYDLYRVITPSYYSNQPSTPPLDPLVPLTKTHGEPRPPPFPKRANIRYPGRRSSILRDTLHFHTCNTEWSLVIRYRDVLCSNRQVGSGPRGVPRLSQGRSGDARSAGSYEEQRTYIKRLKPLGLVLFWSHGLCVCCLTSSVLREM